MADETRARSRSLLSDNLKESLQKAPREARTTINTIGAKTAPKKPLHPATVHWPFAFLSLAVGLDLLYAVGPRLPGFIANSLPTTTDLTRASYFLLSLGLITAIPATMSGIQQMVTAIKKQGLTEGEGGPVRQKFKATIAHAVSMDIVLALATYVWYSKRSAAAQSLLGAKAGGVASSVLGGAAAYAPTRGLIIGETIFLLGLFFSANIGGSLTYNFGFGMAIGGQGKK